MRISDWSSDVCSSDLIAVHVGHGCVVVADELNMRKLGANQPVHPLAQLVNIEGRLTQRLALRGYQPIDQAGQAIGLGNDALRGIGRASWRERVCQSVSSSVVAVSLKTHKTT